MEARDERHTASCMIEVAGRILGEMDLSMNVDEQ